MAVDSTKILKELRGEEKKRGAVTLYLDREVYVAFKKGCAGFAPSKVLEKLMRDYIADRKKTSEK